MALTKQGMSIGANLRDVANTTDAAQKTALDFYVNTQTSDEKRHLMIKLDIQLKEIISAANRARRGVKLQLGVS